MKTLSSETAPLVAPTRSSLLRPYALIFNGHKGIRVRFWIGIRNVTYNMGRLASLKCPKVAKGRWRDVPMAVLGRCSGKNMGKKNGQYKKGT